MVFPATFWWQLTSPQIEAPPRISIWISPSLRVATSSANSQTPNFITSSLFLDTEVPHRSLYLAGFAASAFPIASALATTRSSVGTSPSRRVVYQPPKAA